MNNWTHKIFGIALGNALVSYDYILYGFLGSTLAQLFFPQENKFLALMSVFLIFASSCLVRPIGAFLFGLIGDKYGRKTSLVSSIFLMSGASVLIGCLPTYHAIGQLSVVLLVLSRILQGLSMSGEEVGSAIYLIESAPKDRKSLAGSVVFASVHMGLFFSALLIAVCLACIPTNEFMVWGWRIPFLASLPIAFIALYLRLKQSDSSEFDALRHNKGFIYPLKEVFRHYKLTLIVGTLIATLLSISIYLYSVYTPNFLKTYHQFTTLHVLFFSMASFFVSAIAVLGVGALGDKIGLYRPILWAALAFIILSPLAFWLSAQQSLSAVVSSQIVFILIVALASGTLMSLLNTFFPVEIRFTGIATCFNFSMTIFGSTAPIIILALHKASNAAMFPAIYMVTVGLIVMAILLLALKRRII